MMESHRWSMVVVEFADVENTTRSQCVTCSRQTNQRLQPPPTLSFPRSRKRKRFTNVIIHCYTILLTMLVGTGFIKVYGQMLLTPIVTVATLHQASTTISIEPPRDRRTAVSTLPPLPKFPIRIDCGTTTYVDPITKHRWRGGSSYIQDRSLSRNHHIRSTEKITIPSSLQSHINTTTSNHYNDTWMIMAAAPKRVYRTHKYYRTLKSTDTVMPRKNRTTKFQFNIPVESSVMHNNGSKKNISTATRLTKEANSNVVRVYTVRFHFAETVRSLSTNVVG